ncbi:MAG TPA: AMP-dependent synthetase, partial [Clostridiales bacterium]|nr:AMP-dependent synthetase [Clostridiales bacterium]
DGWFRTGDLGVLSGRGHLRITGRVKSMIVLKNGKKVFPEEIESLINKQLAFVKESMVWGEPDVDSDVDICARIVLDREKVIEELGAEPDETHLKKLLDTAIRKVNSIMPSFKTVRYYTYGYQDLVKTTTLKVKRYIEVERIRKALAGASTSVKAAAGRNIDALLERLSHLFERN